MAGVQVEAMLRHRNGAAESGTRIDSRIRLIKKVRACALTFFCGQTWLQRDKTGGDGAGSVLEENGGVEGEAAGGAAVEGEAGISTEADGKGSSGLDEASGDGDLLEVAIGAGFF